MPNILIWLNFIIMSRTGNVPIDIPEGVEVVKDNLNLIIKGKSGEKKFTHHKDLDIAIDGKKITVKAKNDNKKTKMIWGTTRSILNSLIYGNIETYQKNLELIGTGYKAQLQGKNLKISAGFSHDIDFTIPEGISIKCPDPNKIEISGSDKQIVGQIAAELRSFRKPEPYKGKGIKFETEIIHRKEGKKK